MRFAPGFLLLVALPLSAGCTAAGGGTAGDDDDDGAAWTPLILAEWTLAPYSELTSDTHVQTMDRDVYIGAIRPVDPPGTHHTVLYRDNGSVANMIYASGVNTGEIHFPPGVGLKVQAGDQLGLQLHLFNVAETEISGTSGIEVLEVPAADVVDEADIFLPGPFDFLLQPQNTTTVQSTCSISGAQTIFALFPHMHQLGTHFKTTVTAGGSTTVLHDAPYYFDDQAFTAFTPMALAPGDTITTECTWNNTTTSAVVWGESSEAEMCFSILYRWPDYSEEFCPPPI